MIQGLQNLGKSLEIIEIKIMTESTVAPGPFKGQQTDEPITWLKRFVNYCKFKAYDETRQLALFRALMQDTASDWLESIPDETACLLYTSPSPRD